MRGKRSGERGTGKEDAEDDSRLWFCEFVFFGLSYYNTPLVVFSIAMHTFAVVPIVTTLRIKPHLPGLRECNFCRVPSRSFDCALKSYNSP